MTKTKKLVLASLFAALTAIGTMLHIPAGALGYLHLGDAMVLLSGILLGPIYGGLGAAIGSMLADIINGYAIYAPGTFLIKGICAWIAAMLFRHLPMNKEKSSRFILPIIILGIVSEAVMVLGYYAYEIGMLMMTQGSTEATTAAVTALSGVPYNIVQGIIAVILTVVLIPLFSKIQEFRNLLHNS